MKFSKKTLVIILILLIVLIADIFWEINFPKTERVEIKTEKIAKGEEIKILQISDLHSTIFFNNNKYLYQQIKDANPDIIVITGDFIDKRTSDYRYVYSFIDEISKLNKNIYFVFGDHEQKDIKTITTELLKRRVIVLDTQSIVFTKNNQNINLLGLNYYNDSKSLDFIRSATNERLYSVLLAHNPDFAIENKNIGVDLVLSGDTHGGQVRLPIIGAIFVPGQFVFPKYTKGIYKLSERATLYIDSGLGNTFFPIRFLNQSQISLITITGQ
ncbi:MAG: metallophosphoesterase [Candidatus Paceibacterota bacterium]